MEATAAAAGPALSTSPKPARVRRLPTRAASGRIALPSSPGSPHLGDSAAAPSALGNGGGSRPGSPLGPISAGACAAAGRSGGTASGLFASPRRLPAGGEDEEARGSVGADGGSVAGPRFHAVDDGAFDTRREPSGDAPTGSPAAAAAAAAAATSDVARGLPAAVALGAGTSDSASGGVAALAARSPTTATASQPVASLPPPSPDPPSNGNPGSRTPPPPAAAPSPPQPPPPAGGEAAGGSLSGAGPLNASATLGAAAALPIKRRGSYQGMKARAGGGASASGDGGSGGGSGLKSENPPSLMDLVARKRTHWECFGTILVLCCMDASEGFGRQVMQMLQAEGYDTRVVANMADALAEFSTRDALPDVVLVDCGVRAFSGTSLISKLQVRNPTVAILCMGTGSGPVTAVSALQAGAADFISQPVDLDELVVRIERHVQRQHCLKLEMESVLEAMGSLAAAPAGKPGAAAAAAAGRRNAVGGGGGGGAPALIAVAEETDFEQQITELSEENARLMATLQQMQARLSIGESEKALLHTQLHSLEVRQKLSEGSLHTYGEKVGAVTDANSNLAAKVEALERMMMDSREAIASLTQGGGGGSDNVPCSLLDPQCSEVQDL